MEDDSSVFQKSVGSKDTHLFGGSGRFWIAFACGVALCMVIVIGTYKGTSLDAASVAILAGIVSIYMGQNKTK